MDEYVWHWEIVRGCGKEAVGSGVTVFGRLRVKTGGCLDLCHYHAGWGGGAARVREREAVCLTLFGEVKRLRARTSRNCFAAIVRNNSNCLLLGRAACPGAPAGNPVHPWLKGHPARFYSKTTTRLQIQDTKQIQLGIRELGG